ncbi:MAG: adenylate/guanylate cyclase domain-containing protein [Flavobacteriales bacterium]|nr:adenylate/guanylate cyclase domain-containing protein [Flavobacteriales bacterium]
MANERILRTRLRVQRVLRITAVWVLLGCLAALFEHDALEKNGYPSLLRDRLDERFLTSLLAGLSGGALYIFVLRDRWRKLPYTKAVGVMALLLLAIVVVLSAVVPAHRQQSPDFARLLGERFFSLQFLGTYLYWLLLMGGTMLMVRLNDQYGNGGINYLTGFYHKPRQEMRIFMFLDMRSSTAIAERLGHVKYFQLLNELYADITDPILYSRGEIYQYVGDEISVSWSLRRGVGRQRCIRCFLNISRKLKARGAHYEARYGLAPIFKAGFHYGPVTTGEVGLVKKERIYSGDVVNTAAHIQNQCNAHGVDNLISQDLVEVLRLPSNYRLREIGSTELKGKRTAIRLWTLVHDANTEASAAPGEAPLQKM